MGECNDIISCKYVKVVSGKYTDWKILHSVCPDMSTKSLMPPTSDAANSSYNKQ